MEKKSAKSTKKTASPKNKRSKKDFLVVGLGASAGGVKALQEFFATMPPNSGMAFVAILHLSPEHESSLPQIIQAQTQMQVTQVTETVKVEPNNVYVIPPNVQLEMVDGVIRPSQAERKLGHRVAIDVFFRTLAEAYEKNAVCVVLSGTGSDGTLGLKRVKESNGFAIVQSPEDAEYDSMPRSAINTQLADWVLPVHQMPDRLIHFRESSERLHLTNGADAEKVAKEIHADESLREILTILRVRTGHDFSSYKTPTLIRRIARHLQIHELEDIPSYLELLRREPGEVQSLLKNLLINVTNFFRDRAAFAALQAEAIPKIFDGKTGRDTVRVWSCGCASGEEAYSLAMILQEYADTLPDPPKIQVFASDVDDEALSEAREHRYAESIEADVSPERLKKFFVKEGAYYRVRKELRETVLFAPHSVLRDPPFSRLDLVACRNVMIYLNRQAQERVLEIFHFALVNQGFLFLGSSETADGTGHLFAALDRKEKIYSRRHSAGHNYLPMMPDSGRWDVRLPEDKAQARRERQIALSDIHYKLLENYAPSSVLVNQDFDIVYLSGTAGKFMRYASGEPSNNILKAVNPDLLPDLRAALFTAQREHTFSEFPNVRVTIDGEQRTINIIVRAVDVADELADFLLVIFEERNPPSVVETTNLIESARDKDEAMENIVRRLEEDLQRTKEHLRFTLEQHDTTIEELKAANEELQAINEELRSSGEELETSKEELQSVNEELTTVNHELKEKILEATHVNSDLQNLMAATDIATIFLDKNLKIKRYTPPVEDLFNITTLDIGRPLEHFTHNLNFERMTQEAAKVLRTLKPVERETADHDGKAYLARFLPYRTIDDRIDGVVLNFIDITARKQTEEALQASEEKYRTLFNSIDEGFAIVEVFPDERDRVTDLVYLEANEAFERHSGMRDFVGKRVSEILPALEQHWLDMLTHIYKTGEPARIENYIAELDRWLNVHYSRVGSTGSRFVAVVFDDITERKRREERQKYILELSDQIRPLTDPDEIRSTAMRLMGSHLEVNRAAYVDAERDPDTMSVISDYTSGVQPWLGKISLSDFGAALGKDFAEGKTVAIADVQNDDRFADSRDVYAALEIGAAVGVPLLKDDQIVAAMGVHNKTPRNWTADEISIIEETAERTWAAVERARAEEALSESEEKYRTLFDSIDEGVGTIELIFDENERVVDYIYLEQNPAFERQTGLPGDVIGKPISEVIPDLEAFWFETFERVAKTGEPERFEHEVAALDKWFEVYVSRIGSAGSRKIVYVYNDITERRRAGAALRESEERLRDVLDSMAEGFALLDGDFTILDVNRETLRLDGRGRGELIGRSHWEAFPGTEDSPVGEIFRRVAREHAPAALEHEYRWSDEHSLWIDMRAYPTGDGGVAVFWRDFTDRKRAEDLLRESEEKYRTLFESIDEGFCIFELQFDKKGKAVDWIYLEANPAFERQTGYIKPVGKRISDFQPDLERSWFNRFAEVARTGKAVRFVQFSEAMKIWYDVYAFRVGEAGENRVSLLFTDITERKRTEEALRESEEKYRTLFNSIDEGFCTIEVLFNKSGKAVDYRFLNANPAFERQTGLVRAMGKTIREVAPEHEEFWFEVYGEIAKTGKARRFEHEAAALGKFYDVYAFRIGEPAERKVAIIFKDIAERRKAEQLLAASEEHYRAIINQNLAGILEIDLKGTVLFANDEFCRMLGYKCARLVGQPMTMFVYPDDLPASVKKLKQMQRDNGAFEMEKRFVRKDGSAIWVHNSISPIRNGDDKIHSAVIVSLDITERKQTDEALRESEERIRIAIEAGELGTWEWDIPAGRVIWNEQHYKLFGMKPTAKPLTPEDFFYHVHPDDREWVGERLETAVKKKIPFEAEFRATVEHDGVRWMSGYGRVIETGRGGKTTKMSGVMLDITDRKNIGEIVRKSEEQLNLILESTKDYAIIAFDLEGKITRWNAGAERIFGWTESEIVGKNGDILFTPEDRAHGVPEKEMQTALKKGRAEDERWHLRKDGSRFFASGVMQPLKDGEIEGYVKIARDQTDRLEAENILREKDVLRRLVQTQEDERRRIARDIHDHFGQQLTALRLKLDEAKAMCSDQDVCDGIDAAGEAAKNLDAEVDFIAWELRPAALDDLGLLVTLNNFVREWSHHTHVEAEFHFAGLGKRQFDFETATNLYRIAQEALNNIYKHARAKKVSVLLERRRDKIVLIVEDDGAGFDTASKKNRRKGIGLIGMEERAKILGGDFEIESQKNGGTTVFARVPLENKK